MKKKLEKMVLLIGIVGMMGISAYGCGKAEESPEGGLQAETEEGEPEKKADLEDDAASEQDMDASKTTPETDTQSQDTSGTSENTGKEEDGNGTGAESDSTSSSWDSITPDLEGDVKEISGTQFTVVEAEQSELDDGGKIMALPSAEGDDSGFNKMTVTYDDTTLFSVKTIYGGGASCDVKDASVSDLAEGKSVEVWGDTQDGGLKATHIRIVKVEG